MALRSSTRTAAKTTGDVGGEDRLRDKLLQMWIFLISHNSGARRYRSPLLSFCAMLSIEPSTSSWMEQLPISYDSARQERQGQDETLPLVKRCCEKYLQPTVDTPMGEILRWRLLLFRVLQTA